MKRKSVRWWWWWLSLAAAALFVRFRGVGAVARVFQPCTGTLRVCKIGETPGRNRRCSENKLQRHTVYLTGAGWWTSVFNMWIAQIILEEQLQVPVEIANVHGGNTDFWKYDDRTLDVLDTRVYNWDAIHTATNQSMDCARGWIESNLDVPSDLKSTSCTENCKPCAHAMLEVWPGGQEDTFAKYAFGEKTIEYGGALGLAAEHGWYATKHALESNALLATYRGLKDANATKTFQRPLKFGEYCLRRKKEWDWIVSSDDPFALRVEIPTHFCHYFFQYAMQQQHNEFYTDANAASYLQLRDEQIGKCASIDDSHCSLRTLDNKPCDAYDGVACFRYKCSYMNICPFYWVTQKRLGKAMPYAEGDLIRVGYENQQFLYRGAFETEADNNGSPVGFLMTSSCHDSGGARNFMDFSKGKLWSKHDKKWSKDVFGEMGYSRWKNYDHDIIAENHLKIKPVNMPLDMLDVLETSGRLAQEDGFSKHSPILLSTSRPNSIFQRYKYRHDEEWGNFSGEPFKLAKLQLPSYESSCEATRRPYADRCSATYKHANGTSGCGYGPENAYKVFSTKLQSYAPEAYYFLKRFEIGLSNQEHILASIDFDSKHTNKFPSVRYRDVICEWVQNNTKVWREWLPDTAHRVRCLGEIGNPLVPLGPGEQRVYCSGHGTCVASEAYPNAGDCECDLGYQGDDCSGLVDPSLENLKFQSLSFQFIAVLSGITFIVSVVFLWIIYRNRKSSVVFQKGHPLFCFFLVFSVWLGVADIPLWVGPVTKWHCIFRPIFMVFPYSISMSAMFIKVFRRKLEKATNSEDIQQLVGVVTLLQISLFVVWFLFFPPDTLDIRLFPQVHLKLSTCQYGRTLAAFEALFFMFNVLMTLLVLKWSFEVRYKTTYFNEGADIRISISLIFLINVVGFVICHFISPLSEPNEVGKFLCVSLSILLSAWTILYFLLWPKIFVHYYRKEINDKINGLYRPKGDPDLPLFEEFKLMMPKSLLSSFKSLRSFRVSERYKVENPSRREGLQRRGKARPKSSPRITPVGKKEGGDEKVSEVLSVSLSHRTSEMNLLIEKKYREAVKVNNQLIKICGEHKIDPETGEMEEDFTHALEILEEKQIEEINLIDDMYQEKYSRLKEKFAERQKELKMSHRQEMKELEIAGYAKREDLAAAAVNAVVDMKRSEVELTLLRGTLASHLPSLDDVLMETRLEMYAEYFADMGVESLHDLLVVTEEKLLEFMKKGHVRRLLSALSEYKKGWEAVAKKQLSSSPSPSSSSIASASETFRDEEKRKGKKDRWKRSIDIKTGRYYWYNKALKKSVWVAPEGWESPRSQTSAATPLAINDDDDDDGNATDDGLDVLLLKDDGGCELENGSDSEKENSDVDEGDANDNGENLTPRIAQV